MHQSLTSSWITSLALWALSMTGIANAQTSVDAQEEQVIKQAVNLASPSVVRIETLGGLEKVGEVLVGTGPTTGLIVSADGYVLSSAFNFIQQPSSILVTLPNGKRAAARIISRDRSRMLVLLKVNTDQELTPAIPVPRDQMQVGQWTIAIGRTFDLKRCNASVGILSATNRIWGKSIQTDAKISPSNYGGPLVDIRGRTMGILVPLSPQQQGEVAGAEWYDSGIGFAVPLVDILPHLDTLKAGKDLYPGLLGISLKGKDIYADPAIVAVCQAKSPAADAGLQVGDRIVEINGLPITRQAQLKHALGTQYAGDVVKVAFTRGTERIEKDVTLTDKLEAYEHPFLGLLPARNSADQAGVLVRYVYPESAASQAGIMAGDLVIALQDTPVNNAAELRTAVANGAIKQALAIKIKRAGKDQTLTVTLTGLPKQVPPSIPPTPDVAGEPPADRPAVGMIEIKIPEEQNTCQAYIPENYRPDVSHGAIIWLHEPGANKQDPVIEQWKALCQREHLILVAPRSLDPARWQATEVAFVRKVLEDILANYQVDPTRIVVHGHKAGGALAYLTAFEHRDVIRAVVPIDAALPRRSPLKPNDPLERLAIYSFTPQGSRLSKPIEASLQQLQKMKYPVSSVTLANPKGTLPEAELEKLVRWIDTLDRI
ncbi:MAG: PDZ domain-containing protein [Pirellulaceae bacterium]|nr:PDZ domain-containing protein [Pirellulaceae bacterium]